jgi:hypothetical protein
VTTDGVAAGRLRDDPDFRRFLGARLISLTGTSVTYVAFPVVMYALSGRSPFLTALVAAFEALPYLLLGLPAGALADRFDRKRVMVVADVVNACVLASVPMAHWLGVLTVGHLLLASFVVPALFVFFDAADFGAVPTLVGRARIAVANSAIWSTSTVIETVVPLLAGALLAVVDGASLIALDAMSYLASALLIRGLRRPLSDRSHVPERLTRRALVADVREGLHFLWGHATVRSMTAVGACQSIAGGAFVGQMVVWADRSLDVRQGDWRLGVLFSTWGVGVLVATLSLPRLVALAGAARVTLLGLPASALLCVLTALSTSWVVGSLLLIGWGMAYMTVVTNSITYRQQVTPEHLMSRVNTTGRMLSFGLGWPIGSVLGGLVANATGPRGGMLAGAAVLVAGVAVGWLSPLRSEGVTPATVAG